MKEKDYIKYLKQKSWFHGTTLSEWARIRKYKVRCDFNEGSELDFGYGFYLTPTFKQAASYINRTLPYRDDYDEPIVIEFELCLNDIINDYKHTVFLHFDEEFAKFVIQCRSHPMEKTHDYDFILGVMTDSNPKQLFNDYRHHNISFDEVLNGLMKWNSMEQLSLHNQDLCDILRVKKVTKINTGEELDFYVLGKI